ncbi:MAG: threonine synthase [Magnetococcales bacterium]|nr:threonine synthase [Magnetococcales bacterium]PPR19506.1 MAG: Threonine synthase [Pseudomonadota bacterium]
MHYISTRGFGPVNFRTTVLDGLAPDGGLYVPASYPKFSREELEELSFLSYEDIADKIMSPFIGDSVPSDILSQIIKTAYGKFNDIEVTPLIQYEEDTWIMELFHGPTFAFKDIAMQFLGPILEYTLGEEGTNATVIGATSGDTGPAAIEGLKNSDNINVFMLYPHNRTSAIQRMQMTTSGSQNIFPIAIEGTFDDCQNIVKELFSDLAFKEKINATSINSISWARLLPQMVYYFFAWSRLRDVVPGKEISFSVPTGNFGDAFAGYLAMQCGLPIKSILVATNSNDILTRFINNNDYSSHAVKPTRSPSMDIQIASNFERLLFDIYGRDSDVLKHAMREFKQHKALPKINDLQIDETRSIFSAESISEVDTLKMMSESDFTHNILIDPHTAVGLAAAKKHPELKPIVSLATAHPLKFPSALKEATAKELLFDDELDKMMKTEEVFDILPPDAELVRQYILDNL